MSTEQPVSWDDLWAAARRAATGAYAPYSNLSVGAAGLVDDGRLVSGCNVENASYGLTLCAECALVGDLHRTGGGRLVAVAVTDGDGSPLTPCGRCRQVLAEFGTDLMVYGVANGERVNWQLKDLIPDHFGRDFLDAGPAGGDGTAPPNPGAR